MRCGGVFVLLLAAAGARFAPPFHRHELGHKNVHHDHMPSFGYSDLHAKHAVRPHHALLEEDSLGFDTFHRRHAPVRMSESNHPLEDSLDSAFGSPPDFDFSSLVEATPTHLRAHGTAPEASANREYLHSSSFNHVRHPRGSFEENGLGGDVFSHFRRPEAEPELEESDSDAALLQDSDQELEEEDEGALTGDEEQSLEEQSQSLEEEEAELTGGNEDQSLEEEADQVGAAAEDVDADERDLEVVAHSPRHAPHARYRDLESNDYAHAGTDLELIQKKLDGSTLSAQAKTVYTQQLRQMEDMVSQLSTKTLSESNRDELMKELKARMTPIKAMTQEIDLATPKARDLERETEQRQPLALALDSVKSLKQELGEHLSNGDKANINALIKDLEVFESTTDAEESTDLVKAINGRLPAVESLATHLRSASHVVGQGSTKSMDLEKDEKPTQGPSHPAGSTASVTSKVEEKASTPNEGMGLEKIHKLEEVIAKAELPHDKRTRFMNNLQGLEKDEKALGDESLSAEQRADLESAMKLRLTMLSDMQQFLDKL